MSLLPYNPNIWGQLCFDVLDDGTVSGPVEPTPTCQDAQCAIDTMPEGTGFRAIRLRVPDAAMPATADQLTDIQPVKTLREERDVYPTVWLRTDSSAPLSDLATYRQLVKFGALEMLDIPAEVTIDVVVLVTPNILPVGLPALQRRA